MMDICITLEKAFLKLSEKQEKRESKKEDRVKARFKHKVSDVYTSGGGEAEERGIVH